MEYFRTREYYMEVNVNKIYSISELLKAINSEVIFIIPGSLTEILDEINITETEIITAYHEEQLGYMAIGYYYETKKIPIIIVSQGPGETNLVTSLSTAYREQIPMLVISAYKNDDSKLYFQQTSGECHTPNIFGIMKNITERSYKTEKRLSRKEFEYLQNVILTSKYPIYLCINEFKTNNIGIIEEKINFCNNDITEVDYEKILYNYRKNKEIGILIGYGASSISEKLIYLAQKYNYYIVTTLKAIENVNSNIDKYLGHIGMMGNNNANEFLQNKCETLIAFGTTLSSNTLGKWFKGFSARNAKLIHINKENTLNYTHLNFYKASFLEKNNELYDIKQSAPKKSYNRLVELFHKDFIERTFILEAYRPNFISNLTLKEYEKIMMVGGFGPLGSSISIAIGAAIAHKDKRYIVLCGDGGFLFSGMTLLNVVKYKLPILIVINVNNEYRTIADGQRKRINRTIATELFSPNYSLVSRFFNINQREVKTIEEFKGVYEEFLMSGNSMIIFTNDEIYENIN